MYLSHLQINLMLATVTLMLYVAGMKFSDSMHRSTRHYAVDAMLFLFIWGFFVYLWAAWWVFLPYVVALVRLSLRVDAMERRHVPAGG